MGRRYHSVPETFKWTERVVMNSGLAKWFGTCQKQDREEDYKQKSNLSLAYTGHRVKNITVNHQHSQFSQ
jgi:hypothetical protein